MKYVPPLGATDPNASYQDGNPEAGILGSIVPAAAIDCSSNFKKGHSPKMGMSPVIIFPS